MSARYSNNLRCGRELLKCATGHSLAAENKAPAWRKNRVCITLSGMAGIDIKHLLRLAQLALTETEQTAARKDLQRIITMVDQMQAVDTEGVEPLAHPLDAVQRLRPDVVTEQVDRELNQQGAPATRDGFYLVPRVVE